MRMHTEKHTVIRIQAQHRPLDETAITGLSLPCRIRGGKEEDVSKHNPSAGEFWVENDHDHKERNDRNQAALKYTQVKKMKIKQE